MARDPISLDLQDWATTVAALVVTPESLGIVRAEGFTAKYGQDHPPELELFNFVWRLLHRSIREIQQRGLLEWDGGGSYLHPAQVIGSDRLQYSSVQAGGEAQDPVTDAADTYWSSSVSDVAHSSTAARGIIRTATVAEALAGPQLFCGHHAAGPPCGTGRAGRRSSRCARHT